jgi:hypothetical protein
MSKVYLLLELLLLRNSVSRIVAVCTNSWCYDFGLLAEANRRTDTPWLLFDYFQLATSANYQFDPHSMTSLGHSCISHA